MVAYINFLASLLMGGKKERKGKEEETNKVIITPAPARPG